MSREVNAAPGLGLPQPSFGPDFATSLENHEVSSKSQQPDVYSPNFEIDPAAASVSKAQPVISQSPQGTARPQYADEPSQASQASVQQAMPMQDIAVSAQADDDSKLDEEWVGRAKDIVSHTHNDPYMQSKEMGKLKAQYIKLRYNKDIKTEDN